jgi:hypothetical protein
MSALAEYREETGEIYKISPDFKDRFHDRIY